MVTGAVENGPGAGMQFAAGPRWQDSSVIACRDGQVKNMPGVSNRGKTFAACCEDGCWSCVLSSWLRGKGGREPHRMVLQQ